MEYRTRSIEASLFKYWELGDGRSNSVVVDYQPGNGTRYLLSFLWPVDRECLQHLGAEGGGCIVSWINHGGVMVVPTGNGAFLSWTWVKEKLGVAKSDAVVLAEIIGHIAGVKATTSEQAEVEDDALLARARSAAS